MTDVKITVKTIRSLKRAIDYAISRGGRFVDYDTKEGRTIGTFACSENHTVRSELPINSWCNICHLAEVAAKTDLKLAEISKNSDIKFLGRFNHNKTKILLECPQGHRWGNSTVTNYILYNGNIRCKQCLIDNLEAEVVDFLSQDGGILLDSVRNFRRKSKILILCKNGHKWNVQVYLLLDKNKRMSCCSVRRPAASVGEDVQKFLIKNELKLLKRGSQRATFLCKNNHTFERTVIHTFINKETYVCPDCYSEELLSRVSKYALEHDGRLISSYIKSKQTEVHIVCKRQHDWFVKAEYLFGKDPIWCGHCFERTSKMEREIYIKLLEMYPDLEHNVTKLLKSPRLEIDVWRASKRKGMEFDGVYYHKLDKAPARDARKDKECIEAGITLLRVPENEYTTNPVGTLEKIRIFFK